MKYLGIDYGKSKIGLAMAEESLASPYKVLSVRSLKDALLQVGREIDNLSIDRVVIGVPESGETVIMVKSFVAELAKAVDSSVQIVLSDELLTTQNAALLMREMGAKKSSRGKDDAYSACLILQEYLDNNE